MRHVSLRWIGLLCLVACGGGGGGGGNSSDGSVDAPNENIGFAKPKASLQASMAGSGTNTWVALGSADLSCLGSANADVATTVPVTLDTTVYDFQTPTETVGSASVVAFPGIETGSAFFTGSADGSGNIAIAIPAGITRFGIDMNASGWMNTFLLNQKVDPSTATQTLAKIQIISNNTAQTLPALIGVQRTAGTGVAAGALRDCQAHEMSNFVATVSSTSGTSTPIPGAAAYYFSASVGLPVHHDQQESASQDGLFMVIQLPVAQTAYVQAWGYVTDADLAADKLTLVSELAVPILADTVITGSFEPLRAQ